MQYYIWLCLTKVTVMQRKYVCQVVETKVNYNYRQIFIFFTILYKNILQELLRYKFKYSRWLFWPCLSRLRHFYFNMCENRHTVKHGWIYCEKMGNVLHSTLTLFMCQRNNKFLQKVLGKMFATQQGWSEN